MKKATKLLMNEAEKNHSVLLVGHGFVNRMVAQALVQDGWTGPAKPKGGYWGISIYEKSD